MLIWIQSTRIAMAIAGSTNLTGFLSGLHLLGMTLVVGAALVSGLRMVGVVLTDRPVSEVTSTPVRAMVIGMMISVTSGLLLFSPRGPVAVENSFFQAKMALLGAAILFHFAVYRGVSRQDDARPAAARFAGALGLILWAAVAVAGCAFILFE